MDDQQLQELFSSSKKIAVVGLSPKPERSSYGVAEYLSNHYEIIPVNPVISDWKGQKSYASISEIPKDVSIDIVNIFRRSEHVSTVVDECLERKGIRCIWMQLGVVDEQAAARAEAAGIPVVMDQCLAVVHNRLAA